MTYIHLVLRLFAVIEGYQGICLLTSAGLGIVAAIIALFRHVITKIINPNFKTIRDELEELSISNKKKVEMCEHLLDEIVNVRYNSNVCSED